MELFISIKMDLALNNLEWLMCHKTKPINILGTAVIDYYKCTELNPSWMLTYFDFVPDERKLIEWN